MFRPSMMMGTAACGCALDGGADIRATTNGGELRPLLGVWKPWADVQQRKTRREVKQTMRRYEEGWSVAFYAQPVTLLPHCEPHES
jgi:hypothetical protein